MKLGRMFRRKDTGPSEDEVDAIEDVADSDEPNVELEDADAGLPEPDHVEDTGDANEGSAEPNPVPDSVGVDDDDSRIDREFEEAKFELDSWGSRDRVMIDSRLDSMGIAHAWEAGTLVADSIDAEAIQHLLDEMGDRLGLDLEPSTESVAYDVSEWPRGLVERFIDHLIEKRIAHTSFYTVISVSTEDEKEVDELVEALSAEWDDESDDSEDAPDAQDVMSELFIGADRLKNHPSDRSGAMRFADAAETARDMDLPFGLELEMWSAVTSKVKGLEDLLNDKDADDDAVIEAAEDLRGFLRPLV